MIPIERALSELYAWASSLDFAGHDPHDLLTAPLLRRVRSPLARLIMLQLGRRSVVNLHTLLRVPRAENPKALALFILGVLDAKEKVTPNWSEEAMQLGKRLIALMDKNGGWGYLFPWQSRTHFLASGVPNIVTTSFAGNALIALYRHSGSPEYEEPIHLAEKFIRSLEIREPNAEIRNPMPDTRFPVFAYAQNDSQIVFNASLLGAEFMMNAGELFSNASDIELARRAAHFVAGHQRIDGGWDYGQEKSQTWTDSFHTGFIVCSMKHIAELAEDDELHRSAERGFDFYRNAFLEADGAVRYFPDARYPIDAHALGQAMVTFSQFEEPETARRVAEWSIEHLRSPNGYFYYQRHRLFTNRIPYLRWSNAWMVRGLSCVTKS